MSSESLQGFRLSPQQEHLARVNGERGYPVSACLYDVSGPVEVSALQQALSAVSERHEILRTVFRRHKELKLPLQMILPAAPPKLQVEDLTEFAAPDAEGELLHRFSVAAGQRTPATDTPIVNCTVFRLPGSRHALLVTMPALCADAASFKVLAQELSNSLEEKELTGELIQYVDVTEWQHELLGSTEDAAQAARSFWKAQMHMPLVLPFECEPGSEAAEHATVFVPQADHAALSQAAEEVGASVADLLLAAWQFLLSRIAGVNEVVVAAAADGRDYDEIRNAIGPFARYLPVKADFEGTTRFDEVLRKVAASAKQGRDQQDWFSPGSAASQPQIGFSYDRLDAEREQSSRTTLSVLKIRAVLEDLKLCLSASETEGQHQLEIEFALDRYSRAFVEQLASSLANLLDGIAHDPRLPLSEARLLSAPDQHKMVELGTGARFSVDPAPMHVLISAQAARTPGSLAVRGGEGSLTYAELEERSNRLAHFLVGCGVKPGSLVGLLVGRSAGMMMAVLAILKAGGAYVALGADQPRPRIAQQLAGIEVLITESALLDQFSPFAGRTVVLDGADRAWEQEPASDPGVTIAEDALAYVIYTSGSTGTPKGVGVRHRNLVNYASHMVRALELEPGLQFATVSTLAADLGNTVVFPALMTGGCLHVLSYEVATDARRMAAYNAEHGIDVLKIVPSHLAALLDAGAEDGSGVLPRRYLITGGEALKPALVERVAAHCAVINHYGPTETTVGSLMLPLDDFDWKSTKLATIPLGRPISNTRVYVLDANRQLVPPGVAGELYIAGAGVTAGYIGQPERTAERFVPDPFGLEPDQTMYRTGDLVRWLPSGLIEFLGRTDDQVKIRGFRVELGEIESVLAAQPGVRQSVVLARPKPGMDGAVEDRQVVAYVVLDRQHGVTPAALKQALAERLPDYMVPAAFVELSRLPLTANGKIDRKQLPEPEERASRAYIAPASATEELVAQIWAEVLKVQQISTDENFFDLGGHSLLATQVISRMRRVLGVDLPLRTMFDVPTVSRIAQQVVHVRLPGGSGALPAIVPVPRSGPMPLSFAQQRLWVLDQLEPNNSLYNIARTIRLHGELDVDALTRALNEIVRRHEPLRTWFAQEDSQPVQHILPQHNFEVREVDLTDVAPAERESAAHAIAAQEAATPFDLSHAPLLRVSLLRLDSDDHVLLMTMHHIVSDAWSAAIFMDELRALYDSFTGGKPSGLSELNAQYADYAIWQRNWLEGETLSKQLTFWRDQLAGAPPLLNLPTDRPRPEKPSFAGGLVRTTLPAEVIQPLKALCRQHGVTLFMALLAAFQALLSRVSGQEQVVVGTDSANRFSVETERMIGFFINLLPLKGDLTGDPTFLELLGRVRETTLACYARQEMPFDKIVEELRPDRKLSHNPIVQVLFVMQNAPAATREIGGLKASSFHLPQTRSKFDLAWFAIERGDGVEILSVYSTDLFDESSVTDLLGSFATLLTHAMGRPETRVSALDLLSKSQKKKVQDERQERKQNSRNRLMSAGPKAFTPQMTTGE